MLEELNGMERKKKRERELKKDINDEDEWWRLKTT